MTINKLSSLYIGADIILIMVSIFVGKFWLANTQAAFICSMLVTFASYLSYKIMIDKRIENQNFGDKKDFYDELEDPYNVFDDESKDDIINTPKQAKKEGKLKNIVKGLVVGLSGALSIYRLLSYLFLFLVILFLIRHGIFNAVAFFIGLSVVPIISLLSGFLVRD